MSRVRSSSLRKIVDQIRCEHAGIPEGTPKCPFCRGSDLAVDGSDGDYWIACGRCFSTGPVGESPEGAWAAWIVHLWRAVADS